MRQTNLHGPYLSFDLHDVELKIGINLHVNVMFELTDSAVDVGTTY